MHLQPSIGPLFFFTRTEHIVLVSSFYRLAFRQAYHYLYSRAEPVNRSLSVLQGRNCWQTDHFSYLPRNNLQTDHFQYNCCKPIIFSISSRKLLQTEPFQCFGAEKKLVTRCLRLNLPVRLLFSVFRSQPVGSTVVSQSCILSVVDRVHLTRSLSLRNLFFEIRGNQPSMTSSGYTTVGGDYL